LSCGCKSTAFSFYGSIPYTVRLKNNPKMIQNKTVLAIIPARGGSKRILNKNIKDFAGKPLIAWTIIEAKKSSYIDRLITSTDSKEIAAVARELGSEVPFLRPAELASDAVQDFPVFLHALEYLREKENYIPDIVVQLRPTSPLRVVEDIDKAIELLANHAEVDSVRTVTEPDQSPYKMYKVDESGLLAPILRSGETEESFNLPQQKLPQVYKHVGYVDAIWSRTILDKKQMSGDRILPLIIENAYSGLNRPEEWERYEYVMKKRDVQI
jgi:CMP-N-acetylneuraminic acid synthetase